VRININFSYKVLTGTKSYLFLSKVENYPLRLKAIITY